MSFDENKIQQLRYDLSYAYRICEKHNFSEGVCNHLTASFQHPKAKSDYGVSLCIAHGLDWSEVTPESLVIFDNLTGEIIEGDGEVENSAFHIHSVIHRTIPEAKVIFHTHMSYATALMSLAYPTNNKDNINCGNLQMINQNCMRYYDDISYDNEYQGFVNHQQEGLRIAEMLGNKKILFMRNHGVLVTGNNIYEVWDDLYYLERACMNQILALSTNKPLQIITNEICKEAKKQKDNNIYKYAKLHFESQVRIHFNTNSK
jgi:ribulose-5-phosphate 4-epimerase/fuculose-1-phosphate aldolase